MEFTKTGSKIEIEKLYGDFKKMHDYIRLTFQNEINEYERIEQLTSKEKTEAYDQMIIAPLS